MFHMELNRESAALLVAQAVSAAIEASPKTIVEISELTGIPRTTLFRRLRGRSPFTISELDAIADALGVSLSRFLTEAGAA